MTMPPGIRKLMLAIHLTFSIGWIGAVVAYLAMSIAAITTQQTETVRASWIAMDLIGWYVIVPLALASLVTGLVMALGTKWGLFRHYWVVFSLVMTVIATVVLLLHMPSVSVLADAARAMNPAGPVTKVQARLRQGDLLHPGLGLIVLFVVQVLNVYKPRGLTRYGQSKERRQAAGTAA